MYGEDFCTIHAALQKYGDNNFIFFSIETLDDEKEAYKAEMSWIDILEAKTNGYNETYGGEGAMCGPGNPMFGKTHSLETKQKMSDKQRGELNPMFGRKHSEQTKILQRKAKEGKQYGENNPNALLTNQQANDIRVEASIGLLSRQELAKKYGVSKRTIGKVVRNEIYRRK